MLRILSEIVVRLSASAAISLMVKATAVVTLGFMSAWLARRGRAAVRHALLASAFGVLLALPVVSSIATPVMIGVPVVARDSIGLPLFDDNLLSSPGQTASSRLSAAPAQPEWTLRSLARMLARMPLSTMLLYGWLMGIAVFVIPVLRGLLQVRSLRQFGLPWRHGQAVAERLAPRARGVEVLLHEALPGPMTCGVLRPVVILPEDAQSWEEEDLERALVHELEHVRRYDWAIHCLARVACAAYWFHPLVWAACRQLTLEAERSCDDAVLGNSEATAYADQLLGLARRRSAVRRSPALAMANRSDLAARIQALLDGSQRRGPVGALLVAAACIAAAAMVLAMSPLRMVAAPQGDARAPAQDIPKWDAVSIKRCTSPPVIRAEGQGAGAAQSPNRITANCTTLEGLVQGAYIVWAGGHMNMLESFTTPHEGFPGWTSSERYTIEAKAEGTPGQTMMWGPMMQALLEDRFRLKVHTETREGRVYILSAAKGGIKMQALQPGTCESRDYVFSKDRAPGRANPPANPCPFQNDAHHGPDWAFDDWLSMDSLATFLTGLTQGPDSLGAPILNKTGLTGAYHVQLQWSDSNAPADASSYPSIFTAVQKLGLTLEAGKGPRQFLVFDHAERPTEN